MKISELIEAKKTPLTLDFIYKGLDDVFEYESDYPLDEISIKGLDRKGSSILVDVESRRSERDVTATVTLKGGKAHVEIFGGGRDIAAADGEEPLELGKDIIGYIAGVVERHDEEDDEGEDDGEDWNEED